MPLVRKSKRLPRIPANVSLASKGAEPPPAVVEARMGVFVMAERMASQNRTPLAVGRRGSGYEGGVGCKHKEVNLI